MDTYNYKGTNYVGGNGLNPQQVAAQNNPELKDPTRNLSLAAGSPLDFTGALGSSTNAANTSTQFGQALQQMLQKYQQLGNHATAQLQTGVLNYSDAGINAQNAQLTNSQLHGYAPSTIFNAGSTASAPYEAGAAGLKQVGQTFNEQLSNFGNSLSNAKDLMTTYQAQQEKAKADAQTLIQTAISAGGDAISTLIKSQPDLVKLSGLHLDTLQSIADASKQQATTFQTEDIGGQKVRFGFDKSGNITSKTVLGSTTKSPTTTAQQYLDAAGSYFESDQTVNVPNSTQNGQAIKGDDGYVNPDAWNAAYDEAIAKNVTPAKFVSTYKKYVNPTHPQDYKGVGGLKPKSTSTGTVTNPFQ